MPEKPTYRAPRDDPGERQPAGRRDQRVVQPVHDQRRHVELAQPLGAVGLRDDGRELARVAARVDAAVEAAAADLAQPVDVEREALASR